MIRLLKCHQESSWPGSAVLALILFLSCIAAVPVHAADPEKGIGDFPSLSDETDWPWWRGPSRNGHATRSAAPPTRISVADAKWKVEVPGRGHSSPIVIGDTIVLTTADEKKQAHSVLAYRLSDGSSLWSRQINTGGFPAKNHPKNTEATPTVACDGERLFATFFHHKGIEVSTLNLKGEVGWKKRIGGFDPKRYEYGYAPSPLIYKDKVIIAAEYDGDSYIAALNRTDGKQAWRIPRPKNITFSSPVVGFVGGKDQLLISGGDKVNSWDPNTGKPLWQAQGTTAATCGTLIWDDVNVYASGGYPKAETLAIKADGSGTVLWKNNQKCYEQSMIIVDGYIYALTDNGVMFCWRASDGNEMWKMRLQGPVSASPVYAGGHIYWANELGSLYVFRPSPDKYDQVAENRIGEDSFPSPAVSGNKLIVRVAQGRGGTRQESLMCFEAK